MAPGSVGGTSLSARMAALTSGFFSSASNCVNGRPESLRKVSRRWNMWYVLMLVTNPIGRVAICGVMEMPSAFAFSTMSRHLRHWSGRLPFWASVNVQLRPLSLAISANNSTSCSVVHFSGPAISPTTPAGTAWNTPLLTSFIARPMASNSAFSAKVPGIGSPSIDRCPIVREVENPSAPALSPSLTILHIASRSSLVASS